MFFDVGLKSTVNYSVFGHLTLKNHGICSGFCFSPRKNTVNNSNFAVFSCFSLFFELRWSAIHGYQILRVFFFRQSVLSDVFGLNGRHHWQLRAVAKVWEQHRENPHDLVTHHSTTLFAPQLLRSTFRSAPESCPCCVSPTMRCGRLPSRSDVNI